MLRRTLLARMAGGGAAAIAVGCSQARRASGPEKLRILAGRSIAMSSLFLTQERGYFAEAGLDVEISQESSSASGLALLGTGKAEASFSSIGVPFLSAMAKGLPVKFVAAREIATRRCGDFGAFFAMRKRFPNGLDDAAVLKGKTIGVGTMIGFPQFSLDAHLATAGLSVDDIIPRTMRTQDAITAVISGSLDAAVLNWDYDKNFERVAKDTVRTPPLSRFHPETQISYIYFGPTLFEKEPGIGGRFLAAYLRGAREYARGATPEYMKRIARQYAADEQQVASTCRETLSLTGEIDRKSIQLISDWAVRRKYLAEPFEPSRHIDNRFLERAHAISNSSR